MLNFSDYDHLLDVPISTNGVWRDLLEGSEYLIENDRLAYHLIKFIGGRCFTGRDKLMRKKVPVFCKIILTVQMLYSVVFTNR